MNLNELKNIAKQTLEQTGQHKPMMFIENKKSKLEIYMLVFDTDEEKEEMLSNLRKMVNKRGIEKYVIIFEAWYSKSILSGRARDNPNREECLIIQECRRDMSNKSIMIPFKREADKIKWDKEVTSESKDVEWNSRWNFFIEDASEERAEQLRWDEFKQKMPNFEKSISDFVERMVEKNGLPDFVDSKEDFKKQLMKTGEKMIKKGRIKMGKEK